MSTIAKSKPSESQRSQFPILCKTWDEYYSLREKFCKPVSVNHKGKPVYDHDIVRKFCIPPSEPR